MSPDPLTVETSGNISLPNYPIAPEDQALADEITGADPVLSTKGPISITGSVKLPATIRASGLPPHLRDPILQQLQSVPADRRETEEQRLVREALYGNSAALRIMAGPGEGANAYQREFFQIERERYDAEQELWRLERELADVERWDNVLDERTGEKKPVPVEKVRGQRRAAMEARRNELVTRISLLDGIEGKRRLERAKFDAVEELKAQRAQLQEAKEARELGAQLARQERIQRQAEAYAKRERNAL